MMYPSEATETCVQPGEEKAAGRPDCSLSVLKGSL